jgi:DME family drug/metabolite transporter
VIVGGGGVEVQPLGVVLALLTALAYTAYLITTDRTVVVSDPLTTATWLGAAACAANVAFSLIFSASSLPDAADWPALLGMIVFSAGAFASMLGGLRRVGAVRNAIIGVMEPVTVAMLAAVFLSEPLSLTTLLGGVLILSGAVIATLVRTTRVREPDI